MKRIGMKDFNFSIMLLLSLLSDLFFINVLNLQSS
jgi:hypothetical protein